MNASELWQAVLHGEVSLFGGIGFVVALLALVGARVTVPAEEKRRVRTPAILLALYVLAVALRLALPESSEAAESISGQLKDATHPDLKLLQALSAFFLLGSLGHSSFLLLLHSIVVRRLSGPVPVILRDLIQGLVYVAVGLVAMSVAGVEPGSLLTTSALLTAVIGLSVQDTLGNLFAGLAIQAQRPFDKGDWIQFDEDEQLVGQVTEMNWRAVTVVTLEHNEITVPNSMLAKAALRNYTRPKNIARRRAYVWAPTDIQPHRVQRLLAGALRELPGVLDDPAPSVITHQFTERGVEYEVRYFIDDFDAREVISGEVHDRIYYALRRARIAVPPPAREVFLHEINRETVAQERELQIGRNKAAIGCVGFLDVLLDEPKHRLAALVDNRIYVAGEVIIRAGETGSELFIIETGEVRVEVRRGRQKREVARLGPGQFFGEMSLMTGEQRVATIRAMKDTAVLVADKRAFSSVLEASPELAETVSQMLAEREEELAGFDSGEVSEAGISRSERSSQLLTRIKHFFALPGADNGGDP